MTLYRQRGGTVTATGLRLRNGGGSLLPQRKAGPTGATAYAAEPLGAGGWITGMVISPDGATRLARTDTSGAWRWDSAADQWVSTTNASSMPAGYGNMDVQSGVFGLAASNSLAYMAWHGSIFTSTDRGVTWGLSLAVGPKDSPNVSGVKRWTSHMAIDPNNPLVCLYGTVNAGLYYTTDGGANWTVVPAATVPIGTDGASTPGTSTFGIPCVLIDGSGNWYAAPFNSGLYQSTDQGGTWTKISTDAQFKAITGMDYAPNGDLMVLGTATTPLNSSNVLAWRRRAGVWAQLSTGGNNNQQRVVAYDRLTPGRVMVQGDGGYEFISLDYGNTWVTMNHTFNSDGDIPWLAASAGGTAGHSFYSDIGGLQFDPLVANRVWMSQGIGVWYADLPTSTAAAIPWKAQSRGIEQLVVNDAIAPPGGSAVGGAVAVSWDRPIFLTGEVGSSGTKYPYRYHPTDALFGSAWHIDYSADNPQWLAASMGNHQTIGNGTPSGYSTDGGATWTQFATIPTNGTNGAWAGSMHVGAPGHAIWVSALGYGVYRTTDSGATWSPVTISGVTMSAMNTRQHYFYRRPVTSEKTAGYADTFYLHASGVGFYKSTDAGATWVQQCGNTPFASNDWSQMEYLKSVPDQPGHLFVTPGWLGAGGGAETLGLPFKRSTDGGVTWTTVAGITSVRGFDFGIGKAGSTYPAIYAIGWVNGVKGVYRSDDNAATWTLLSTQPIGTVDFIRNVAASKDAYGKHWITTNGSGLIAGQLV